MVSKLILVSLSGDLSVLSSKNLLKAMMPGERNPFPFEDRNQKLLVGCFEKFSSWFNGRFDGGLCLLSCWVT